MAAAPSVGPTVRCSTISMGTGSAPPLMSSARSRASSAPKEPVICVEPDGRPTLQPMDGATWGDLGRGDHLVVKDDRDPPPIVLNGMTGGFAGHPGPVPARALVEVEGNGPAGALLSVEGGPGVLDARAGETGRAQGERAALLVGQRQPGGLPLPLPLLLFRAGALDGVEAELGGPADDFGGLARVLDVGQFDDDPVLSGPGQGRFGDAERVDALAEHLKGSVGALPVRLRGGRVLGLEHQPGAALKIEAESG
jgi:hypothetical protein